MVEAYMRRLPSAPGLLESGNYLDTSLQSGCEMLACASMSPCVILSSVLRSAQAQHRLTYGPCAAGKLMSERNLSRVLACVLVDVDGMDMNSILIGAFCLENNIRIIKVSPLSGLLSLLSQMESSPSHKDAIKRDLNCIVIEHSKDGVPSTEDELLMNFYQLQTRNHLPLHITLPD